MELPKTNPAEHVDETEEEIKARAQLWKQMYGFAETFMLRFAVQLGIPDLIHEHGGPMTLLQLASKLPIASINMNRFQRTMTYMVHMNLFTITLAADDENDDHAIINGGVVDNVKYGLTPASKLLLKGQQKSFASYVVMQTDPDVFSVWGSYLVECLDESRTETCCWESFFGMSAFEKMKMDPKWNKKMGDGMTSGSECMVQALVDGLLREKAFDAQEGIKSLVDVGGNSGNVAKAILNAFPHLKCTVMDLPHVIQSVPKDPKLDFVAGDMFHSIPSADVVLFKL